MEGIKHTHYGNVWKEWKHIYLEVPYQEVIDGVWDICNNHVSISLRLNILGRQAGGVDLQKILMHCFLPPYFHLSVYIISKGDSSVQPPKEEQFVVPGLYLNTSYVVRGHFLK